MKTENRKREYCEYCGIDFTNRSYSEKIHHSNYCNEHNAMVKIFRFKECNDEGKKLRWLTDSVGLDINYEDINKVSYTSTMEIFTCLINMYTTGIYNYKTRRKEKFLDVVMYMLSRKDEIKKYYNFLLERKITEVMKMAR